MEGISRKAKCFFIKPVASGLGGFLLFLSLLAFMKFLSSWLTPNTKFVIDNEDILLSMVGFVLMFLIVFLQNFTDSKNSH